VSRLNATSVSAWTIWSTRNAGYSSAMPTARTSCSAALCRSRYPNVNVFCVGACRNNVGNWEVRQVHPIRRRKILHTTPPRTSRCSERCAGDFWTVESKGTLHNILNLIAAARRCLCNFAPEKTFHKAIESQDLDALVSRCDRREMERISRPLPCWRRGHRNTSSSVMPDLKSRRGRTRPVRPSGTTSWHDDGVDQPLSQTISFSAWAGHQRQLEGNAEEPNGAMERPSPSSRMAIRSLARRRIRLPAKIHHHGRQGGRRYRDLHHHRESLAIRT